MNKRLLSILGLTLVTGEFLPSLPATAEEAGPFARLANTPMGRLFSANLGRLLVLRSELGVTEEQRTRVREIVKSHRDSLAPAVEAVAARRQALRKAVTAEQPQEEAIRKAAEDLGKAIGDAAVAVAKVKAEAKQVFSREQQEKIDQFLSETDVSRDRFFQELKEKQ